MRTRLINPLWETQPILTKKKKNKTKIGDFVPCLIEHDARWFDRSNCHGRVEDGRRTIENGLDSWIAGFIHVEPHLSSLNLFINSSHTIFNRVKLSHHHFLSHLRWSSGHCSWASATRRLPSFFQIPLSLFDPRILKDFWTLLLPETDITGYFLAIASKLPSSLDGLFYSFWMLPWS